MGEHEAAEPLEPAGPPVVVVQPAWYAAAVKAVLAFLAIVATNAFADLHSGRPWPEDGGEWLRWALTIIVGTYAVYRIPNAKPTVEPATPAAPGVE